MKRIFGENGLLGDVLGSCEYRDEQLAMSEYISERLSEREHAFIEAGTGTGKTLAYLVPAVLYAIENEKKITLTTETRALQK
ncbi:MAG TPA: helicase c2, partial [Spirochaetota bacterium]|nr:helicase c2 [Spirochaetota bacterium]